jgi:F-type H+-transporting ATPase subunit delta
MTTSVYAKRYATAIFRTALESKELNRWQSDIRKVGELLQDKALFSLLENQQATGDEKASVLSQRLGPVNPLVIKLVSSLAAKGKLALVTDVADEFQRLADSYRGIEGAETAEVTTAIPLDESYQLKLAQRITDIVGKPVILKTKVDPAILGGVVIRVGDKLIDGSIRSKLEALRKELSRVSK